ncbi:hypothetical protein AB1Y20_020900 [Prymnesium parvum]|uniref:Uncharacterized protein n=1 Tax=Prymnesium parvum TaxID=97485 RepID=A0AB34JYY9_PRYPA
MPKPRETPLHVCRCGQLTEHREAHAVAPAAGRGGHASVKRTADACTSRPPAQRLRPEGQTGAASYPFSEQCAPGKCPGWERALYALVLLRHTQQSASDEADSTKGANGDVTAAEFPETALNLIGVRWDSAIARAPARLGLVLQTMRHLAAFQMNTIFLFNEVLPTWRLQEVCMPPEALHRFMVKVYSLDSKYCKSRIRRWVMFRPLVNAVLSHNVLRQLLEAVSNDVSNQLSNTRLPRGLSHWWELWAVEPSHIFPVAFITDTATEAGRGLLYSQHQGQASLSSWGEGERLTEKVVGLQAEVDELKEELDRANVALRSAQATSQ